MDTKYIGSTKRVTKKLITHIGDKHTN
jgi:hypothetical protein